MSAPTKKGGMALAMVACGAMCGLPILIASASVLASPLLGPVALLLGAAAVLAVVLLRRRRASCAPTPPVVDERIDA